MNFTAEEREYIKQFVAQCPKCDGRFLKADLIAVEVSSGAERTEHRICRRCFGRLRVADTRALGKAYGISHKRLLFLSKMFTSSMNLGTRAKHIGHTLDFEDVCKLWVGQRGICALSGVEMDIDRRYRSNLLIPSLDRIDSKKDYADGNVHLVCWGINLMKQDLTVKEFVGFCRKVARHSEVSA